MNMFVRNVGNRIQFRSDKQEYVRAATPTGLCVVPPGRSACGLPKRLVALR